jgi:hypothetical protein
MRKAVVSILLAISMTASMQAAGHDRNGHTNSRVGVGFYFGAPLYWDSWWGGYNYYYPPPVVIRPPLVFYDRHGNPVPNLVLAPGEPLVYYDRYGNPVPPVQAQMQQAQPQPQPEGPAPVWFFCTDSNSYYPYVRTCPSAWQRVAPFPPPPPQ